MEIKEINKIIQSEDKDEKSKSVKCICINYGDFLADCEGFVQKRYHDFKCNPKHQFEKKADTILETINEQISNFAQTYPTNLKASSNEALLFMRRYRFANCSCFSCCFKDAYPSSNVQ